MYPNSSLDCCARNCIAGRAKSLVNAPVAVSVYSDNIWLWFKHLHAIISCFLLLRMASYVGGALQQIQYRGGN